MDVKTRNREELKSYFVKNSIPTQSNFAELVDGMLNQNDDGVVKNTGSPLSIQAEGVDDSLKQALSFYRSFEDDVPDWIINLNPRADANDTGTAFVGLGITDGEGKNRLFIDRSSGSIGVGTITPTAKLQVKGAQNKVGLSIGTGADGNDLTVDVAEGQGLVSLVAGAKINAAGNGYTFLGTRGASRLNLHDGSILFYTSNGTDGTAGAAASGLESGKAKLVISNAGNVGIGELGPAQKLVISASHNEGKDSASSLTYGGNLALKGNAPQLDFIDTDHNEWAIHVNANKMYFIRQPWEHKDLVLDGAGNVGVGTDVPLATLHVGRGADASLTTDGYLLLGDKAGANVIIDNNEIMARNNGQKSPLYLQADGGDLIVGPNNEERFSLVAGKLTLNGTKQIIFTNTDTTNNLKLQLWGGYGLGINGSTLFYAANGNHSWRNADGATERMRLTTKADGGLHVYGSGKSTFSGPVSSQKVYFSAYVESNSRSNALNPLPMKNVSQNVGGGWSTATSKFTAPVAGVYLFTMTGFKTGGTNEWLHWYLRLNNGYVNSGGGGEAGEKALMSWFLTNTTCSRTVIVNLNKGDTVHVQQAGTGRVDNYRSGLEGVLLNAN